MVEANYKTFNKITVMLIIAIFNFHHFFYHWSKLQNLSDL